MSTKEHRALDPLILRLKEASLRKLIAAANDAFRNGTLREVRHGVGLHPQPNQNCQGQTGTSH
ncbi:hypothetical protein [Roseateles depolymerans]|uniref:Uncharacterized protein n=1 Tax=Roseateles depolymerans TaxID=76731 RepID=A0A0U3L118_9BURK|nr:hypothetical protein [Roseateles depolymerans]ALV05022.1 hypothetical protein RD2015_521 [Roseateles depolymerans]REG14966.1 hypothetical protein DES44_3471 [Roseateles depolymerans]